MSSQALPTWSTIFSALSVGQNLSYEDARWAMDSIMSADAGEARLGAFLMGLKCKGEVVEELSGLSDSMRAHAKPLNAQGPCLDIVGTGGDQLNTVNISTMSMIVCAAAGARIVKHGNRSASSMSGSADVLEALGVNLQAPASEVENIFSDVGLTFAFAQTFHPAFRFAGPARKQLGIPTIFNILGPLTNPAQPEASAIGTPHEASAQLLAGVLARRGSRGLVFRGHDGLDELTVTDLSTIWEIREGKITSETIDPQELGLGLWEIKDLTGGDATHNAKVVRRVVSGEHGAIRDAVLLNAAAGLVALDQAFDLPLSERLIKGISRAAEAIDSGAAEKKLTQWIQRTQLSQA